MRKYKVEIETPILKTCTVELNADSVEQIQNNIDSVLKSNNLEEGSLPWEYEEDGLTVLLVEESVLKLGKGTRVIDLKKSDQCEPHEDDYDYKKEDSE